MTEQNKTTTIPLPVQGKDIDSIMQSLESGVEELFTRQSDVDTFKANQTSIVYASDGSVISTLKGEKDSYYVSIEEMPVDAVTAIVSIEDKKFFRHHGIDYRALLRAVKAMVQNGEVKQGGQSCSPGRWCAPASRPPSPRAGCHYYNSNCIFQVRLFQDQEQRYCQ